LEPGCTADEKDGYLAGPLVKSLKKISTEAVYWTAKKSCMEWLVRTQGRGKISGEAGMPSEKNGEKLEYC
jgi:hypothetical protein